MSIPNDPAVIAALQSVLDTVELHRDRSDHEAAHAFMDAVQAHFEMILSQVEPPAEEPK